MNSRISRYGNKKMLLFLLGLGLLIFALWYFFHPASPYNERSHYIAAFSDVGPLDDAPNVKVGGIPVGKILSVHKTDSCIYVGFEISKSIALPKDSKFLFASSGFLGNRILSIELGLSPELYTSKDTIRNTLFDKGMGSANQDLEQSAAELKNILDTAKKTFDDFESGESGKQIERVMHKGKRLVRTVDSKSLDLKDSVSATIENLSAAAKKLESAIEKIFGEVGELQDSSKATFEKLQALRTSAEKLQSEIAEISAKLERDDNSAALLLQKGKLSAELKKIQGDVKALLADIKKNGIKLNVDFF